jgi:glycosyltransferase involved in cell wall biosynthesis
MKKILIVSQYFYPENFRVNDIASQLVQRGFDVTVLTGIPNYPSGKFFQGFSIFKTKKEILYQGVNVIRLPILARGKNKVGLALNYLSFWLLGSLFSLFTSKKFDLVFTYGISPILQGSISNIYASRFKVKSYLYLMDFWPYSIEAVDGIRNKLILKYLSKISKSIYSRSDKILISSQGYESDLIKFGVNPSKIIYWPQYHEDLYKPLQTDYSTTPELNPNRFNITFTGNLGYAQGLDSFIEFIKEYKDRLTHIGCMFNFIGDGRAKIELKKQVLHYHLENLVTFMDSMNSERIPQYLANSKVALLIMKDNQFMNIVLPAKVSTYVGCKIPILAIAMNSLAEFIEKHHFGISSHSYDKAMIMKTVEEMIHNYDILNDKMKSSEDFFMQNRLMNQLTNLFLN